MRTTFFILATALAIVSALEPLDLTQGIPSNDALVERFQALVAESPERDERFFTSTTSWSTQTASSFRNFIDGCNGKATYQIIVSVDEDPCEVGDLASWASSMTSSDKLFITASSSVALDEIYYGNYEGTDLFYYEAVSCDIIDVKPNIDVDEGTIEQPTLGDGMFCGTFDNGDCLQGSDSDSTSNGAEAKAIAYCSDTGSDVRAAYYVEIKDVPLSSDNTIEDLDISVYVRYEDDSKSACDDFLDSQSQNVNAIPCVDTSASSSLTASVAAVVVAAFAALFM